MITRRIFPWLSFGVIIAVLSLGFLHFGVSVGGDAERYIAVGQSILDALFLGEDLDVADRSLILHYLLTDLLAGTGDYLFEEALAFVWICLNIVAYSGMVFLISKLWAQQVSDPIGLTTFCLLIYIVVGLPADVLKHNYSAISSDILAVSLQGVFLYFFIRAVVTEKTLSYLLAALLAIACALTRPSGAVLILFLPLAVAATALARGQSNRLAVLVLFFLFPALLTFLLWPGVLYLARLGSHWAQAVVDPLPGWVAGAFYHGVVVKGLRETWLGTSYAFWDLVIVAAHRFLYFVLPFRSGFSMVHSIVNAVYLIFMATAVVAGWQYLRHLGRGYKLLAPLLVALWFFFALFHTMFIVDDSRYQVTMWPPLWILAGYGVVNMVSKPKRTLHEV